MSAKQTLKQRKALRSAAAKPRSSQDAAQERAIGFYNGIAVTAEHYERLLKARECAREMVWHDLAEPVALVVPPPPLCRDCKHSSPGSVYTRCAASIEPEKSLIDGSIKLRWDVAEVNRKYEHLCGKEGRHFVQRTEPPENVADAYQSISCTAAKPRSSLWQRIKGWFA